MKIIYFALFISLLSGCKLLHQVNETYKSNYQNIYFDSEKKRFYYLERNHVGFTSYSEGYYSQTKKSIYLHAFSQDSCINYQMMETHMDSELIIRCENFDSRIKTVLNINNKTYQVPESGVISIDIKELSLPLIIKFNIFFPGSYNIGCGHRLDVLETKVTINELNKDKGLLFNYKVNYNYFNWIQQTDSLEIKSKKELVFYNSKAVFKKIKPNEKIKNTDYLNTCLLIQHKGVLPNINFPIKDSLKK